MDSLAGAHHPIRSRTLGRLPLRPEPQRAALELGEFRRRSGDDLVAHRLGAAFAVCRKIRYLQQDLRLAWRGRGAADVVLLGAELNAEMEHQTARDTTDRPRKPMGRRGAYVADTVAPRG